MFWDLQKASAPAGETAAKTARSAATISSETMFVLGVGIATLHRRPPGPPLGGVDKRPEWRAYGVRRAKTAVKVISVPSTQSDSGT